MAILQTLNKASIPIRASSPERLVTRLDGTQYQNAGGASVRETIIGTPLPEVKLNAHPE
jgi:hypothetical protein